MYYIPSYYDDFYYPSDRYEMLRRQRAHEQARRAAAEKQLREEMLRRRMYEEELARREREEYYRRLAMEQERSRQAQLRKQRAMEIEAARHDAEDEYVAVRGPGGRMYLVRRSDIVGSNRPSRSNTVTRNTPSRRMDARTGFNDDENGDGVEHLRDENPLEGPREAFPPLMQHNEMQLPHGKSATTKLPKQRQKKQKITVIVEDASDSETEDDELRSLWRNRHPVAGESWMEPIATSNRF